MIKYILEDVLAVWPKPLVLSPVISGFQILPSFISNLKNRYFFSREGLLEIMDTIDFSTIALSDIPCYATCFNLIKENVEYFDIRDFYGKETKDILLASSAIPKIFSAVKIRGDEYYDGGLKDNVPIKPLYDLGIRNFIVVHLEPKSHIDYMKYLDINLIEINPLKDLGGKLGTLDFSKKGAVWRLEQGYMDAKKTLGLKWKINFN